MDGVFSERKKTIKNPAWKGEKRQNRKGGEDKKEGGSPKKKRKRTIFNKSDMMKKSVSKPRIRKKIVDDSVIGLLILQVCDKLQEKFSYRKLK